MKHKIFYKILLSFLISYYGFGQILIKGKVTEIDSLTPLAHAYVINLKTKVGNLTTSFGEFQIAASEQDTLCFSMIGYKKIKIKASLFMQHSEKNVIALESNAYTFKPIIVNEFKIKPHERAYMERVIQNSRYTTLSVFESPITAIYNNFSKKGKEQKKLAKIFERIFIEEHIKLKFNETILRKLTDDEKIDFESFRKYCYNVSDAFILENEGYTLYAAIMNCYKQWKKEGRR